MIRSFFSKKIVALMVIADSEPSLIVKTQMRWKLGDGFQNLTDQVLQPNFLADGELVEMMGCEPIEQVWKSGDRRSRSGSVEAVADGGVETGTRPVLRALHDLSLIHI